LLQTPLLDLLGIEHPIIQAGMGTFGSGAALAAAVSNAGAIGSIGAAKRSPDDLQHELGSLRERTDRSIIVNFTRPWLQLHPDCLEIALAARPRAISLSLGLPGDLVARIHDAGALVIAQVQTVEQACLAADEGVDIVIAQGMEAGGFGGRIVGSVLVPQVVDALSPLPVVAAGGISDGRGLAAVLLFGAAGANIGTRFLASVEASVSDEWKQRIVETPPDEMVRFDTPAATLPAGVDDTVLRPSRVPSPGQGAGAIRSIESAADIVASLVQGAEETLLRAFALVVEPATV
jgi:nitronate monooxygenase/enoyl-[acyl-carrier protein] reductase II